MEQFLRVGVIASTHGIRGEVKVYPTTDDLSRFETLKEVVLVTQRKEHLPLTVAGVKFFKQFAILKIELKQAQKQKNVTYEEISKEQGIAKGTVQKVLCPTTDLQTISLENLIAVCGALGVKLSICAE